VELVASYATQIEVDLHAPDDAAIPDDGDGTVRLESLLPDGIGESTADITSGRAVIGRVAPGSYKVFVDRMRGFAPSVSKAVTVGVTAEPRTLTVRVELDRGATVEGCVTDGVGAALEGVYVSEGFPEWSTSYVTKTDHDGRFVVENMGDVPLQLFQDGLERRTVTIPRGTSHIDVVLERAPP
jgi:hypothetical protein